MDRLATMSLVLTAVVPLFVAVVTARLGRREVAAKVVQARR
jgi:hypothetical protein